MVLQLACTVLRPAYLMSAALRRSHGPSLPCRPHGHTPEIAGWAKVERAADKGLGCENAPVDRDVSRSAQRALWRPPRDSSARRCRH